MFADTAYFYVERVALVPDAADLPVSPVALTAAYGSATCPWVVVFGSWGALVAWGVGDGSRSWPRRLWTWLWSRDEHVPARAAAMMTGSVALVIWLATALAIGERIFGLVRTPGAALILFVGLLVASAVVIGLSASLPARLLTTLLSQPWLRWARPLMPPGVLLCIGGALGIWLAIRWIDQRLDLAALPWVYGVAAVAGVATAGATRPLLARGSLRTRMVLATCLGVVAALGALPAATSRRPAVLASIRSQPGYAAAWLASAAVVLDWDGDGALNLYGGDDCRPFNSAIHALAMEIPNNGVDEDCSGRDLTQTPENTLRSGRRGHERPSDLIPRPHIILITTDGLTFERTGLGGNPSPVTPRLDAWAARATTFTRGFSYGPSTESTLPALLVGSLTQEVATVHSRSNGLPTVALRAGTDTLATMLRALGYRTVGLLPTREFFDASSWPGLSQGFMVFSFAAEATTRREFPEAAKLHTGPALTHLAIEEIARDDGPLFLWVHYYDHHQPNHPRPEWGALAARARTPVERFDAELEFADRSWGELFDAIEQRWSPREYLIIFTADHGEAFDANHAKLRHAFSLHTTELHVPFIVQASRGRGRRVRELVSTLDVVPTLADLVPIQSRHRWPGESLVETVFRGGKPEKDYVLAAMVKTTELAYGRTDLQRIGIRTLEWYLVHDFGRGRRWLARWQDDALERNDLTSQYPDVVERLGFTLRQEMGHRATLP